ncbi:hypothetical protein P3536_23890, partial [Vibrio parahaemolyticus]|nr:hypothetical protein [Vibrio parahaemolyticus]
MASLFKSWMFNRKVKFVARKLIPWLLMSGKKDKYSKEEIDYAIVRSELPEKYLELAYAIYREELVNSDTHKKEGYEKYVTDKSKFGIDTMKSNSKDYAPQSTSDFSGDCG